ncbi:hypothetical protein JMUB6875_32770 [Nocardia sp. JMUB6875]
MAADELSLKEALSTVALLLIAGHETTSNLILGTVLTLLRNPVDLERVRSDPSYLDTIIDAALSSDPPLPVATLRQAHSPIDLADHRVNPGELLMVSLLAANQDLESDSRHLSFGAGIHYCLGARLARTEVTAAVSHLINRYPTMSLATPPHTLRWRRSIVFRRLESLPVHLG